MPITAPATGITAPLRDLNAWAAHFRDTEIPICAETAEAIEALRANEDAVDANSLGEMIASDPLMTLKVLAHASTHRSARAVTDVETVISALVMMGISPFFGAFGRQPSVEGLLAEQHEAFHGLKQTMVRSHRAASFALGFAVHRMDHDAPVIHTAALLHDFVEMLMWCHAPLLALRIRDLQQDDPSLRSSAAQRDVLGIELSDLQQTLMKGWRLPELLIRISDDRHADAASVQNVMLAVRLARHTSSGWDNPAIPDDIGAIAELLNLSPEATLQFVREI